MLSHCHLASSTRFINHCNREKIFVKQTFILMGPHGRTCPLFLSSRVVNVDCRQLPLQAELTLTITTEFPNELFTFAVSNLINVSLRGRSFWLRPKTRRTYDCHLFTGYEYFLSLSNWQSCSLSLPSQWPHNLHETYQLPRVQLITPDDGHSRCPKHVIFCNKIKILDTWCILLVIYTNTSS